MALYAFVWCMTDTLLTNGTLNGGIVTTPAKVAAVLKAVG
jgi:hypothetical protein